MASQERINKMNTNMLRLIKDEETLNECREWRRPMTMHVCYHDGPGIQFFDVEHRPILPDLLRDEEQALTLWMALTDNAPINLQWFR